MWEIVNIFFHHLQDFIISIVHKPNQFQSLEYKAQRLAVFDFNFQKIFVENWDSFDGSLRQDNA